jgi:hypothetical protein
VNGGDSYYHYSTAGRLAGNSMGFDEPALAAPVLRVTAWLGFWSVNGV